MSSINHGRYSQPTIPDKKFNFSKSKPSHAPDAFNSHDYKSVQSCSTERSQKQEYPHSHDNNSTRKSPSSPVGDMLNSEQHTDALKTQE